MTRTDSLIEDIIDRINSEVYYSIVCTAMKGYGSDHLPIPLSKTYLSIVPEENKTNYFVNDEGQNCMRNYITIRINFFSPLGMKPETIHNLAESIFDFLGNIYLENLTGFEIGDTEYDDYVKAYKITARLFMCYESCPLDGDDANRVALIPENFFCKHHVNDSVAHLSESEHEYLNEPFVTGTFIGTGGEEMQYITLGFKPKFVIVYKSTMHAVTYSVSEAMTKCYFAFAMDATYTRGLLITSTGFRVRNVIATTVGSYLNDLDATYTYIAFK